MNIEFPTLVYRTPGSHQCHGGTYSCEPASDAAHLDSLLEAGWFLSLPEAIAGEHDESRYQAHAPGEYEQREPTAQEWLLAKAKELDLNPEDSLTSDELLFLICHAFAAKPEEEVDDSAQPTREELEAKATELGLKFDGRTTDKSLAEKIEAALADSEQE